ncbi:MAG TPA: polyprenyl synthetase family protein [Rectinemataceae bacterium]|nr:polyprenyl synthetase family protein [Rectinemataceae bacterium]
MSEQRSAQDYLAARRSDILRSLEAISGERGAELERALPGGKELVDRIFEYASRGKMLRGSLVYLGAELFGRAGAPGLAETAAAMEFFQAGLLIHDDIMDRDERRRGAPSVHAAYTEGASAAGAGDPSHLGESLAICAGDVCFFEALRLLSAVAVGVGASGSSGGAAAASLIALCGSELSVVGLAQMADCRFGELPAEPTEAEILAMYRGKTARYSFSMPLAVGAALAGRDDTRAAIFAIGDLAGLAFQLRDDEIGLYGDSERTGKVAGSDIRENKKTLWRARLFARAGEEDRRRLLTLYGNRDIDSLDVDHVRKLTAALGVRSEIAQWRDTMIEEAKGLVAALDASDESARAILVDLVEWLVNRKY